MKFAITAPLHEHTNPEVQNSTWTKGCFTLQSITEADPSGNKEAKFNRFRQVVYMSCDWWILTHAICLYLSVVFIVMIDGSVT